MIPIVLTTFNRPRALERMLESLSKTYTAGVPHTIVLVQDDGSEDEIFELLDKYLVKKHPLVQIHNLAAWSSREGSDPNRARRRSLELVFEGTDFPFVITVESDLLFHPEWLQKLLGLYGLCEKPPDGPLTLMGTQLATLSPYRGRSWRWQEKVTRGQGFGTRIQVGGVCHLIPRWWYEQGKQKGGWMAWEKRAGLRDWPPTCGGWDFMMSKQAQGMGLRFATLVPSMVEHDPGPEGSTSGSHLGKKDRAMDFEGDA